MGEFYLINDIHLSDRAPASCTDTYLDDLFTMLEQVRDAAIEDQASGIILAGDVFHHKTPSRTSHATVMRLIDWARHSVTGGVPVYAVLGNHDLSHDRIASVDETQPLGVVIKSGAVKLLDGWMDDEYSSPVYGVPWQMTYDQANVRDALQNYREQGRCEPHYLVVTHAPLYPPGRELKFEFFPAKDWASAMGDDGTVHYGHVHEDHGIYTVGEVVFSNCGALSRGSLSEHNRTRTPKIAVWNSVTGETDHRTVRAKPAEQVFHLARADAEKTHALDLSNFLSSVVATRLDVTSVGSVVDHVRETQTDPKLVNVITELLEQA
jgi:Icc-related predicted phosphoesterase